MYIRLSQAVSNLVLERERETHQRTETNQPSQKIAIAMCSFERETVLQACILTFDCLFKQDAQIVDIFEIRQKTLSILPSSTIPWKH